MPRTETFGVLCFHIYYILLLTSHFGLRTVYLIIMLKRLELSGFKSFDKKTRLDLGSRITAVVGPNGSGKSNVAEALRWVLGEQSLKSLRGKRGEDLIFNGSRTVAKLNRATVSLVFDNAAKRFNLPYDEITITREVYRDGVNRYLVNGSQVRLKDVLEILAAVGVGGTSHHIISQGEADRILNTSGKERREIIEEALGLKLFQYKWEESAKKLEKTQENIREVHLLRREIAPHLKYLEKQIEKLEKADAIRAELLARYKEYLAREKQYLGRERDRIAHERSALIAARNEVPHIEEGDIRAKLATLRASKDELVRTLGRIEGMMSMAQQLPSEPIMRPVSPGERICRYCGQSLPEQIKIEQAEIVPEVQKPPIDQHLLAAQKHDCEVRMKELALDEQLLFEQERTIAAMRERHNELSRKLSVLESDSARLDEFERLFKLEVQEGVMHVGRAVLEFELVTDTFSDDGRSAQEDRKRTIERLKIRLEEAGGTGEDVRKEFSETKARDEHFAREIADLEQAAQSLMVIMADLASRIATQFQSGIEKINEEFQKFFSLLFGGGSASLVLSKEELPEGETKSPETQIDISISMPHKKVKGLHMLSGGERALASIALLFAMSQVNPPPFLVLDETDAALDESNSRRYGDMIERLAQSSQLIVVTHNRETMSRAGVLYGVTMGSDATSKILSVKFEEAVENAK